ncbi:MAG: hypothetical protein DRP08_04820 [Candidatus Aenigmatarchaeota archaeon]|nr:MAG: hypothetical protein DRP08_04820 [Candidatus Aenigmarchaeota archaeon]
MGIRLHNNKILLNNGKIAMHDDCCCEEDACCRQDDGPESITVAISDFSTSWYPYKCHDAYGCDDTFNGNTYTLPRVYANYGSCTWEYNQYRCIKIGSTPYWFYDVIRITASWSPYSLEWRLGALVGWTTVWFGFPGEDCEESWGGITRRCCFRDDLVINNPANPCQSGNSYIVNNNSVVRSSSCYCGIFDGSGTVEITF